jgi:hypothetical protein
MTNVTSLTDRIAARAEEQRKVEEYGDKCMAAFPIIARALGEMRALGLDQPAIVRLLRVIVEEHG